MGCWVARDNRLQLEDMGKGVGWAIRGSWDLAKTTRVGSKPSLFTKSNVAPKRAALGWCGMAFFFFFFNAVVLELLRALQMTCPSKLSDHGTSLGRPAKTLHPGSTESIISTRPQGLSENLAPRISYGSQFFSSRWIFSSQFNKAIMIVC